MKFTIVTPSYNHKDYIETTIKSVLGQTYKNFEYLIVDGASTDGTCDIIEKYRDRLKYYISEKDDGTADAINKGFERAVGDILAYLNSDDYYYEDTLERVAKIFESNPDVDVVYGDCVFVDSKGQFIRYFSEIEDYDRQRLLNNSDFIMQPSTFWRKRVYQEYGPFDKELHYGFDWAFWCELAKNNCKMRRINGVLSANREYDNTKTKSGGKERIRELGYINNKYKTSMLPHAYFGYSYAEMAAVNVSGILNIMLKNAFRLLSYQNIIHHILNYDKSIINGVLPYSLFLKKTSEISLPYHGDCSRLKISLVTPGYNGQSVVLSINNNRIGCYEFTGSKLDIQIEITEREREYNVKMEFDKEYDNPSRSIIRLTSFYLTKKVSARLMKFEFA